MAKYRTEIPPETAAKVMFNHGRICCVCNEPEKAVQIHHIDENPSNHAIENLAVLCLEDHDKTQVRGGFARRLKAADIIRCRDDWIGRVKSRREEADKIAVFRMSGTHAKAAEDSVDIEWKRPAEEMLEAYIRHLPDLRRAVYETARPDWDSGVNGRMKRATAKVIEIFERVLVHLAEWYPPNHFDGKPADRYFSEFTANRSAWHINAHTPFGLTGHGTGLGLDVAGAVLTDLETAIVEVVYVLAGVYLPIRDPDWQKRWEAAAVHPNADELDAMVKETLEKVRDHWAKMQAQRDDQCSPKGAA
jgi:hypothetical protein